jgi:glycosyltransferase involved in cell wall biosynthesis
LRRWGGKPAGRTSAATGAHWLFVGRLAPNKAAHDLVKALAAYRRAYDPEARLLLVGGQGHPLYTEAVRRFVEALGLDGAVEMTGTVSHAELAAAYEASDVFVCLSDHEGFCFPLLEAMHHGLPIVGYDSGAVATTIGNGGLVIRSKTASEVAAAVAKVLMVPGRREVLAAAGRARLADFALDRTAPVMVDQVRIGLRRAGLLR